MTSNHAKGNKRAICLCYQYLFLVSSLHVSTASDKCWGEKPWVRGKGRATLRTGRGTVHSRWDVRVYGRVQL